jgi:hypothetical protein
LSKARRGGAAVRTVATFLAAALATLAVAGTSRYAGSANPPPGTIPGDEGAGGDSREARAPPLRLADSGASWPRSFFESLFGLPRAPRRPAAQPRLPRREPQRQTRGRSSKTTTSPSRTTRLQRRSPSDDGATYRTLCVRLCDGYYWPISFATHKANFGRDSRTCAQSCSAPAALYHYPNPGGEPENMVNLEGLPYTSLRTAFLYRATYDESCKCRPHPWETEAIERHRRYAQPKQLRAAPRSRR